MSDNRSSYLVPGADNVEPQQESSPILLSRLMCPVCHTVNEFETVRPGAYVEEGTDTDFRPLSRRWSNARYQSVNPLLYFMATCSTCFYTREFNRAFREASVESEFSAHELKDVRLRHLAAVGEANGVVRRLGAALWPVPYPVHTAINKILLGILAEKNSANPSNYDLARWYLRVAWLFRELCPAGGPELTSPAGQCRRDLEQSLASLIDDLTRAHERATLLYQFVLNNPHSAQRHPDDHDTPSEWRQDLAVVSWEIERTQESVNALQSRLNLVPERFIGGDSKPHGEAYGEFASYTEYLRSLKLDCPDIPINETEAMTMSRAYYKEAFAAQGGIDRGNGAMLTAYLIGELSRRLACFEDAERYLDMARVAAHVVIKESGDDKPRAALARHLAALAEKQAMSLYQDEPGIEDQ